MGTLHNGASLGDFAKTVLMPGDPLRAKFIADTYLDHKVLVNDVRGIQGYTGEYKGKRISVMASGMGMPSMGIYSYELYNSYDVENIIRVGSCGLIRQDLAIRSLVFGMSAYSNSNFGVQFGFQGNLAPCASFDLLEKAVNVARNNKVDFTVGALYSSDTFYDESKPLGALDKLGVLAVEMEAYALYLNAARAKKKALAICTVSDNPFTGESCTPAQVRETFTAMMEIALEIG